MERLMERDGATARARWSYTSEGSTEGTSDRATERASDRALLKEHLIGLYIMNS